MQDVVIKGGAGRYWHSRFASEDRDSNPIKEWQLADLEMGGSGQFETPALRFLRKHERLLTALKKKFLDLPEIIEIKGYGVDCETTVLGMAAFTLLTKDRSPSWISAKVLRQEIASALDSIIGKQVMRHQVDRGLELMRKHKWLERRRERGVLPKYRAVRLTAEGRKLFKLEPL